MKIDEFAAVIFDMDGLVLDTEPTYTIAWQQTAALLGYSLSEEFCLSLSGLSGTAITKKLLAECGTELDLVRFNQLSGQVWRSYVQQQGLAVKQGFFELLAFIQQHELPYALATNSRRANALECLALAGLSEVFKVIISRDDVPLAKPAPDIFLTVAQRLNVPIEACLVLEDSHTGVLAANEAGAFVCYVPSTPDISELTLRLCDRCEPNLENVLQSLRA